MFFWVTELMSFQLAPAAFWGAGWGKQSDCTSHGVVHQHQHLRCWPGHWFLWWRICTQIVSKQAMWNSFGWRVEATSLNDRAPISNGYSTYLPPFNQLHVGFHSTKGMLCSLQSWSQSTSTSAFVRQKLPVQSVSGQFRLKAEFWLGFKPPESMGQIKTITASSVGWNLES